MIRRPPRSTRLTHSFPTRRSSDLFPGECVEKRHARHACGPAAGLDLERDIAKVLAAIGMMVTEWWCRLDRRFEIIAIESGDLLDVVQARDDARLQARGRPAARVERQLPGVLSTRQKALSLMPMDFFLGNLPAGGTVIGRRRGVSKQMFPH